MYVHRLVAMAYISNPENHPIINHIDGDSNNNHMENLEWCTYSHNSKHAYDTNLNTNKTGVIQLDLNGNEIKRFASVKAAASSVGVTSGALHYAFKNQKCATGGYRWKRA